jgi:hypothetical protein
MAFIIAASCSKEILKEFKEKNWPVDNSPIHQDYPLIKVLYHLRRHNNANTFINHIQWTGSQAPLNFTTLTEDDIIYIVGHGNNQGLYAMGPNHKEALRIKNMDRLIDILTRDGSLKKKIMSRPTSKPLQILLLSCRAGVGFHVVLVQRLYKVLGRNLSVGGAVGFTFGSPRTLSLAYNEVLIYGLPWFMEYGDRSIDLKTAEEATSNKEKSSITYKRKKKEIEQFMVKKENLEKKMKDLVLKLKNTEINKALDELFANHNTDWGTLVSSQFDLYSRAKVSSNLEFDMWFNNILDGYVWAYGASIVRKRDINDFLNQAGVIPLSLMTEK